MSNNYKNTFYDFIDSSDTESADYSNSLNWPKLIDKKLYNARKSRDNSPTFLKKDCLNNDILIMSLEPVPKIWNSQVYQRHNIATLGAKSGRAEYGNN